jgi:hypothetical protein
MPSMLVAVRPKTNDFRPDWWVQTKGWVLEGCDYQRSTCSSVGYGKI